MEFPSYNDKNDHISKLDDQKSSNRHPILSNEKKLVGDFTETPDNNINYLERDHLDSLTLGNDKLCFGKKKYLLLVGIGVLAFWIGKRT